MKTRTRKALRASLGGLAAVALHSGVARAEDFASRPRPPSPLIRLAVSATAGSRDYTVTVSQRDQPGLTTTFGYRIAPGGAVGSFGLQPDEAVHYVDRAFLNAAAGMAMLPPEVVVGARVAYRF